MVRFCLEMTNKRKFFSIDLWNRINNPKINLIDLGERIYVTGVLTPQAFYDVMSACLEFGVVNCEVGYDKRR